VDSVDRRGFFKQVGAVAAVATFAGAATSAPLGIGSSVAGAATNRETALAPSENLRPGENLVVHVKNARSGEIALYVGQREVTIRDRKLAARLVRATR
jgi:hypothetical protein